MLEVTSLDERDPCATQRPAGRGGRQPVRRTVARRPSVGAGPRVGNSLRPRLPCPASAALGRWGVQLVRRSLLGALIAVTVAAVIGGVGAAGTGSDPSGTMLLNGTKVFPIVLAKGPDAGTTTPDGAS